MTDAMVASGSNDAVLDTWLAVDADAYLDARRPAWRAYEVAGLVRHVRRIGEQRARLCIAPAATEIAEVLGLPARARPEARRPAPR